MYVTAPLHQSKNVHQMYTYNKELDFKCFLSSKSCTNYVHL